MKKDKDKKIRLGVSSCLLGEKVRFDGNHRQDRYLTDILNDYIEWVQVCPEVEVGMGIPRESVHLVGSVNKPKMLGTKSGTDWTDKMLRFSESRTRELERMDLCGFIFKKASPSCGIGNVVIRSQKKMRIGKGRGLFAGAFMNSLPLVPVEDEGRLNDANIRENFITRIFGFYRLKNLMANGFRSGELVAFHTIHKYQLLAHSPKHYRQLGQIVANVKNFTKAELEQKYAAGFMEALTFKSTRRKNVNVLQHMQGFFRDVASREKRQDIIEAIKDYEAGYVPLVVPITLIRHFVRSYDVEYLANQVYLNPHPKELMLRNHV